MWADAASRRREGGRVRNTHASMLTSAFYRKERGSDYIAMNRVLEAWKAVGQESLNLPNFITLVRILLIPVFVMLFFTPTPDRSLSAAFVFVVAAITDLLDGYIARRTGQVTKLGKLLDPIADKLLVLSALIFSSTSIASVHWWPSW